jgi:hypothetical protein
MTPLSLKEEFERLQKESGRMRQHTRKQSVGYVTAALGLVAGLAWNDAVKSLIEYFLPLATGTLFAKFIYAIVVTLVVVTLTGYLTRFMDEGERD